MTTKEIEAAMMMLDTDRNGGVSFNEFLRWWNREG
jgi:hypothetical protein